MAKKTAVTSKIPIPLEPLPPLTERSLTRNHSMKIKRHPLETLYKEPSNVLTGAVSKTVRKVIKIRRSNSTLDKIDTRHVTVRQPSYELDWNFKVFNDNEPDNLKHVDDSDSDKTVEGNAKYKTEHGKSLTPALKQCLETLVVKNIKKSLKRPHSRELQGISPTVCDDRHGVEKHKRRLDFTEGAAEKCKLDNWFHLYATSVNQDYGPDFFEYLLKKEDVVKTTVKITNSARACVLNWLVKVNGPGGNAATVQTAAWFFDSVLSKNFVALSKVQILAAACYWVARKLQGRPTTAKTLVIAADNAFTVKDLILAERAVVMKLINKGHPVVAQDFISYFSWVCDASSYVQIRRAATLVYMAGLVHNINLTLQYPSTVAVTAVKNALWLLDKKELLVKLETNYVYMMIAKKEPERNWLSWLLWQALHKITSPDCEYKALIDFVQDQTFLEKLKVFHRDRYYHKFYDLLKVNT